MIGFVYSKNASNVAATDFISHLEDIRKGARTYTYNPFVSIILDGENPWEYYPDGGEGFLRKIVSGVERISEYQNGYVSSYLSENPVRRNWRTSLPVMDKPQFSIWIGHDEDRSLGILAKNVNMLNQKARLPMNFSWKRYILRKAATGSGGSGRVSNSQ